MQFKLEPMQLTIQLEGFEKIWALRRRLQIPHHAIAQVDYQNSTPSMQDYRGFLRFPGTSLPWRFYAGTYKRNGHQEFWYVKMDQPGVLVISIKSGLLNYEKLRITCTPDIAQDIADWWQATK
jgi:hypothetical protein